MADFISTFVFILPGIMAYFWLQLFGLNPSVKHTATEISGIAALLWLPVSFATLLILNGWSLLNTKIFSVQTVWTINELNSATAEIKYLILFLIVSFIVSFLLCWMWGLLGYKFVRFMINKIRKSRGIANLSQSSSVWEEFFVNLEKGKKEKEAVYIVYKIDKPECFVAGSMTKASRPLEADKSLVLEKTDEWTVSVQEHYDFNVKRVYVDTKSGMIVKEIDPNEFKEKEKAISEDAALS
jgi:hypothetical protein